MGGRRRVVAISGVMAGAMGVALMMSGCAAGAANSAVEPDAAIATSGWQPGAGADEALLEGRLALENGCLYVVRSDAERTLPVFPSALASWDAATQTLTYNGETYAVGDEIAAAGGWFGEQLDDT